jgi:hypothetical protein
MTTAPMDGMPAEAPPIPKVYITGSPTPDSQIGDFAVDQTVLLTVAAMVTKKGIQHQKQGKGPYLNLNVHEIRDIRPL